MVSFESDYNNGAHPEVLRHLLQTNDKPSASYGFDEWSESARRKIREACSAEKADIFFLTGGTQTNATVIDAMLLAHEAVIAVDTAHINVHESGAVEASGHKVITLPACDGKLREADLRSYIEAFFADPTWEHMAVPGMVYITFPTELGTLYTQTELESLYSVCRHYGLSLFVDGARMGYGLASDGCDVTLPSLARCCDAFYIGGTKCGALCGEAVVFPRGNAPKGFFTIVKRHGALLAKSRLAGVQFDALFTDNLYFNIARHAIDMAMKMRQIFLEAGFQLRESATNQQFVLLENQQMHRLAQNILFETWERVGEHHTLCRFVTSWATTENDLDELRTALRQLMC